MRILKAALLTLLAILICGAATAGGAAALTPLFLTQSGNTLLYLFHFGLSLLRFPGGGGIHCDLALEDWLFLNRSARWDLDRVRLERNCFQIVGSIQTTCKEPIELKLEFGELGLTNKVVTLLEAPESGTTVGTIECGANSTTIEGAVIGEIPEVSQKGVNQYNKALSEYEVVFKSENKTNKQEITTIELLGVNMTGVHLSSTGFFSGEVALESTGTGTGDGQVTLDTK